MNLAKERVKIIGWEQEYPIILLKEIEEQTVETTNLLWDEVEHLANNKSFYLIADLSESAPPRFEVKLAAKERYKKLGSAVLFLYIYVGDKTLLRIAVKFIASTLKTKKYKLIEDIPAGLKMIKNNS